MVRTIIGRRVAAAVLAGVLVLVLQSSAAVAGGGGQFGPGAAGIGDVYFPLAGNGGYDVRHYDIHARYDPATDRMAARTIVRATATQSLSQFDLDFVGMHVSAVTVNGQPARWTRERAHELVISPGRGIVEGRRFVVVVEYAGVPATSSVPGIPGLKTGVVPTDDGAVIWGEPEVAADWFPVNDHPRDKASYAIHLTVPAPLQAISNGRLVGTQTHGGWTTWSWREDSPMASYLAVAAIGRWDIRRRTGPWGIPILDAVDPRVGGAADHALGMQGRIIRFLAANFGRYPFRDLGAIVDHADLAYSALETQTRPLYDGRLFGGQHDEFVVVHELAHQWYGDNVSVNQWRDIWLNEGFATYSEWLWNQKLGFDSPQQISDDICSGIPATDPVWQIAPAAPGLANLFSGPVYFRGAQTLQALRHVVGKATFFRILRSWAIQHAGSTGSTSQFIALSERIAARQLDGLFHDWLYRHGRPLGCASTAAARTNNGGLSIAPPATRFLVARLGHRML